MKAGRGPSYSWQIILLITCKQAVHGFNSCYYTFCPAHRLNSCPCLAGPCDSVWAEQLSTTGHPGPWWAGVPSSGLFGRCVWSLCSLHREESSAPTDCSLLTQTQTLTPWRDARIKSPDRFKQTVHYLLSALRRIYHYLHQL